MTNSDYRKQVNLKILVASLFALGCFFICLIQDLSFSKWVLNLSHLEILFVGAIVLGFLFWLILHTNQQEKLTIEEENEYLREELKKVKSV